MTLKDKVPMFLAENALVMVQDTINVKNTRQLDSKFILMAGMMNSTT